jgi:xanthine dehydrogenase accessory factor
MTKTERNDSMLRGETMLAIWKAAVEEIRQGRDFVLVTILDVRGSSPRHTGTRFLVKRDGGIVGTIGGGLFEEKVRLFAANALEGRTSHRLMFAFRGMDAKDTEIMCDMVCGGDTQVVLEHVDAADTTNRAIYERLLEMTLNREAGLFFSQVAMPLDAQGEIRHLLVDDKGRQLGGFPGQEAAIGLVPERRRLKPAQLLNVPGPDHAVFLEWIHPTGTVFILGAGHVGTCVAQLAAFVGFKVVAVDDRFEFANRENVPEADEIVVVPSFGECFASLPVAEDSYIVIVTRGHMHDQIVLAQALGTDAAYIGMIGSRRKNRLIYDALLDEGASEEDFKRVHAPIGLPIGGDTPEEIALAIVAEMVQVKNRDNRPRRAARTA